MQYALGFQGVGGKGGEEEREAGVVGVDQRLFPSVGAVAADFPSQPAEAVVFVVASQRFVSIDDVVFHTVSQGSVGGTFHGHLASQPP